MCVMLHLYCHRMIYEIRKLRQLVSTSSLCVSDCVYVVCDHFSLFANQIQTFSFHMKYIFFLFYSTEFRIERWAESEIPREKSEERDCIY